MDFAVRSGDVTAGRYQHVQVVALELGLEKSSERQGKCLARARGRREHLES